MDTSVPPSVLCLLNDKLQYDRLCEVSLFFLITNSSNGVFEYFTVLIIFTILGSGSKLVVTESISIPQLFFNLIHCVVKYEELKIFQAFL